MFQARHNPTIPSADRQRHARVLRMRHAYGALAVSIVPALAAIVTIATAPLANAQDCRVDPNGVDVDCNGVADLSLTKVATSSVVPAGESFSYVIVVQNFGPDPAEHVVVRDYLLTRGEVRVESCLLSIRSEGGVIERFDCMTGAFDGQSSNGFICIGDSGVTLLNPASFEDPGTAILAFSMHADEAVSLDTISTVASDCYDPNPDNNIATAPVLVSATADLSLTKTAIGEVLAPGGSPTIIDIANPPAFPEAPNYVMDSAAVNAGRRIAYVIDVTNDGPSTATNATVRDRLPAGVSIVPGTLFATVTTVDPSDPNDVTTTNASCTTGTPGDPLDPLVCGLGPMAPDATATITFEALVQESLPNGTVLENDATVSSDDIDLDNSNDRASTNTIVRADPVPFADLRIVKFGKPDDEVRAGETLAYTIIVDNLGPDAASGVSIKDLMQSDGDFDVLEIESDRAMTCSSLPAAAGGSPFSVPPADGAVTGVSERYQLDCTLDDPLDVLQADGPPNSGRWVVTVRVRANERQDIDNVADVLAATGDPNLSNNHAEVEHAIDEVVDLGIEKVANPDQGPPNGLVTYVLTVTNNGPSTAENVVVTDIVPAEFAIAGVTSSQGVCDIGTPGDPTDPTTCLLGTIAASDSATMNIDVVLPPDEIEATYYNRATVVGDQFDPNNSNNLAIAPVTVVLPPPQTQPDDPPADQPAPTFGLCGPAPAMSLALTAIGLVGMRRRVRRRAH